MTPGEAAAVVLILLTAPDGHQVLINPDSVTSLHSKKLDKGDVKLFVPGAECLVNLADGKFIAVVETCEMVKRRMERE